VLAPRKNKNGTRTPVHHTNSVHTHHPLELDGVLSPNPQPTRHAPQVQGDGTSASPPRVLVRRGGCGPSSLQGGSLLRGTAARAPRRPSLNIDHGFRCRARLCKTSGTGPTSSNGTTARPQPGTTPCAAAPPSRPSGSLDCSVSRIDSEHLRNSAGELYGLGRRMRYGVPPPEVLSGILLRSALPENDLNLARMVISDGDCLPLCHVPGGPCSLSLSLSLV